MRTTIKKVNPTIEGVKEDARFLAWNFHAISDIDAFLQERTPEHADAAIERAIKALKHHIQVLQSLTQN